jgi:hypothetical protein
MYAWQSVPALHCEVNAEHALVAHASHVAVLLRAGPAPVQSGFAAPHAIDALTPESEEPQSAAHVAPLQAKSSMQRASARYAPPALPDPSHVQDEASPGCARTHW